MAARPSTSLLLAAFAVILAFFVLVLSLPPGVVVVGAFGTAFPLRSPVVAPAASAFAGSSSSGGGGFGFDVIAFAPRRRRWLGAFSFPASPTGGDLRRGGGRRRRRRRIGTASSSSALAAASSPPPPPSTREGQRGLETPKASKERSTFWSAVPEPLLPEKRKVPCDANLDDDGPLPPGAHRTLGFDDDGSAADSVRTCVTTVAVDVSPGTGTGDSISFDGGGVDPDSIVRNLQGMIDGGFTSYQIADGSLTYDDFVGGGGADPSFVQAWAEKHAYGRLRKETPRSVLEKCNFATTIRVPPADSDRPFGNGEAVRESILGSLARTGFECVDSVQVQHRAGSPYHVDVLNVLSDLRREGYVRSVGGINFPPSLLRTASDAGFGITSNMIRCNLLDATRYVAEASEASPPCETLISSPLAGGLLSDRHRSSDDRRRPSPLPSRLTRSERFHVERVLGRWANRHRRGRRGRGGAIDPWQTFQTDLMKTLDEIATKHGVSVASVALRWAMELDGVGSVVVASTLGGLDGNDGRIVDRCRRLREAFTFELDEDDADRLWRAAGWSEGEPSLSGKAPSDSRGEAMMPDLSDRSLWL